MVYYVEVNKVITKFCERKGWQIYNPNRLKKDMNVDKYKYLPTGTGANAAKYCGQM